MVTRQTGLYLGIGGLAVSDGAMYLRMMDVAGAAGQSAVFWVGSIGSLVGYCAWILWLSATLKIRAGSVGRGVLLDGLLLGISAGTAFGAAVVLPQFHATGTELDQIWFLGCLAADTVVIWLSLSVLVTRPDSRRAQLTLLGLAVHVGVDVLHSMALGPAGFWRMRVAELLLVVTLAIWTVAIRADDGGNRVVSAVRQVAGLRGNGLVFAMAVPGVLLATRLWDVETDAAVLLLGAVLVLGLLGSIRIRHLLGALSESNAKLTHQAHHDQLTGVWNRAALADFIQDSEMSRTLRAVLYLDLDRFKAVNDTHGHDAGDAVLIEVAKRTLAATRGSDRVARVGGDEFVVVVTDSDTDIEAFVGRLERVLNSEPFKWNGDTLDVGVSVGLAQRPELVVAPTEEIFSGLLAEADADMLANKRDTRSAPVARLATTTG